jgi:hypothetical protein
MSSRRRPGAPCDFEEVRPGLFIVHNPALGPVLRGEGEREGDRFLLTSQRGEGLIARLRARGFAASTIADQAADLPGPPAVAAPGEPVVRPLVAGERVSYFAADPLGWAPAPAAGPGAVRLRDGWVIRRRRSRGPAGYYQLQGGALAPRDEDTALRIGYAQAALLGAAQVMAAPAEGGLVLPDLPLPAAYGRLLKRIAERTPAGWLVPPPGLPSAAALLARLGVTLITQ